MNKRNKQVVKTSIFIASLLIIILSITYAFINRTLTGTKRQVITAGNLELELLEDENNLTITNAMPVYDEVGMIQDAFTFRLVNKTTININYIVKLIDITTGEKLDTSIVKYGLTKDDEVRIGFLSAIKENKIDEGTVKGNGTIQYSLRFWIDSNIKDESLIKERKLSYRIDVEAVKEAYEQEPVNVKAFSEENLGKSCKIYDDGVDTFLVGQCQNNYIWWSGKLWRIVLKNNDTGNVKMVTDNAITILGYNSLNTTSFGNSYVDQWLQQEFLPTLVNHEEYLKTNNNWNASTIASTTPSRPTGTTVINRTVGLLNSYEYYTTYHNSDGLATNETGYLNNGTYWWLITPANTENLRYVTDKGGFSQINASGAEGVRPTVNLKPEIEIINGIGTIDNPYRLTENTNQIDPGITLLSTRSSGEYIKFNNETYRIVEVENSLTKIIALEKPLELKKSKFSSTSNVVNFATASVKSELESYYQSLDEKTKSIIEPNTNWYFGTVEYGMNYKTSICKTVSSSISTRDCTKTTTVARANIGLSRVGEMFTSHITRGVKEEFWTLSPVTSSNLRAVSSNGNLGNAPATYEYGVRPSMYLKSNVVISKDNTGDGTYEKPYEIELGA